MNLYRIHYAWRNGGVSSSEIEYYESEDRFKVDLLRHHLDVLSKHYGKNWLMYMFARLWRERLDKSTRMTTKIIKVQRVDNDEWVDVEYEFIEPEVRLK